MHASGLQVIDDVKGNQVLLQFAFFYGLLAEGTVFPEVGPVFNADVAESVAVWMMVYPQTVLTGS